MASENDQQTGQIRRLIPVAQFNEYHPDPTEAASRWMIFTNKNGFNRCVVRRGHRVLIDEIEYFIRGITRRVDGNVIVARQQY